MTTPSWRRTYWVVWLANLITAVGMMSFVPFFPSYLEELGLEDRDEIAAWSGVVFGAAPLVAAFMAPVWGALGDRVGRKLMVVRALAAITLFVGAMGFVQSPWQLLALRIAQGVFSGFIAPSVTLVSIGAPEASQGRVAGNLQTSLAAGSIVGPLAGALVASSFGLRAVFLAVSLASGLSLVLVALFAREDGSLRVGSESPDRRSFVRHLVDDVARLRGNAPMRRAVLMLFFIQFGVGATNPQIELYVRDLTGADPASARDMTALLFTALAATSLVATPLWGRYGDRRGHRRAMNRSALGSCAALVAHAVVPLYALLAAARVALGAAASGTGPASYGVAAEETPIERRGGAFGAVFSARALALSVGAMVGGWLCAWLGIRGTFVLGALLIAAASVLWGRGEAEPDPRTRLGESA